MRYMTESEKRTTPGKIFLSRSAAQAALGLPPLRQSSNSKSGWRTGLEKETREESTNVIVRTPQPWNYKGEWDTQREFLAHAP